MATGGLLLLFSMPIVVRPLIGTIENQNKQVADSTLATTDSYILLGGGVSGHSLSEASQVRALELVRCYRKHPAPVILCGGAVYPGQLAEADIAMKTLQELGIPAEHLVTEGASKTSLENLENAREICDRMNWENPVLVTSALHMPRSLLSAQKAGLNVTPAPCGYISEVTNVTLDFFLPDARTLSCFRNWVWEVLGLMFYSIIY